MARTTARKKANQIQALGGTVTIPYRFAPRSYQVRLLDAFMPEEQTGRPKKQRGVWVAHRGSGKGLTAIAGIIVPHMIFTPGTYWHVFPKYTQGKKAVWQPQEGRTYTEQFPPQLVTKKNDTECLIEMDSAVLDPVLGTPLKSVYQIVGGDTLSDHLVGAGPCGVVFDEWPLMDPSAYDFIAPRLRQNKGWALFLYTPRGKNHGWKMYQTALAHPAEWFAELLTVDQTRKDAPGEDGRPVISSEEIDQERREGRAEEIIQQEYYCSFAGYIHGTIYGEALQRARADGRITRVPYDPNRAVGIMLDIGRTDLLAIWFYQVAGSEIRFIDYHAERGASTDTCIHLLQEQRPYHYARICLPHDAKAEFFNEPNSIQSKFETRMRGQVVVAKKELVSVQIDRTRSLFPRFVFDEGKCGRDLGPNIPSGLDSLGNWRRDWNEERQDYSGDPIHDVYSHGAAALATGMLVWEEGLEFLEEDRGRVIETAYATTAFARQGPWGAARGAGRGR